MPTNNFLSDFDPLSQTLEDIMTVIGHSSHESKKASSELQVFILQLTLSHLISKAPEDVQNKLIAESKKEPTRDKVIKLFQKNFTSEEVMASFQAATYTIMEKYFAEVSPHLTDEQRQRIANIIQKQYSDLKRK